MPDQDSMVVRNRKSKSKKYDNISPDHYKPTAKGRYARLQVINIIEIFNLSFALGNALKYILRSGRKPTAKKITDLEKAIWYLKRELKSAKSNANSN